MEYGNLQVGMGDGAGNSRSRQPTGSPQRTDSDNLTDVELHGSSVMNGITDFYGNLDGNPMQNPRPDVLAIDLSDIANQVEEEEHHTGTDLQSVSFRGPMRESSRHLPYRRSDSLDKREGRYKTYVWYSSLNGVRKEQEVEFIEILPVEQNSRKKILTTMRRRHERQGTGLLVLHGSCLYIFQKGQREDEEISRAIFVLDSCDFREVPLEETSKCALDIYPGGPLSQQQFRVFLQSEQNRAEWIMLIKAHSPYFSAQVIEDRETRLELMQSRCEEIEDQMRGIMDHKTYLEERCETLDNELVQQQSDNLRYIQSLEDSLRIAKEDCQQFEGQFRSAWIDLDQKKTQIKQLNEDMDDLLSERVELQGQYQQLTQEMQTQNHRYEMELKNVKSQLSKALDTQEEYEAKIVSLNLELNQAKEDSKSDSNLDELSRDFAQQMEQASEQLQMAQQRIEALEKDKEELETKLQVSDLKAGDLQKQLEQQYTPRGVRRQGSAYAPASDLGLEDDLLFLEDVEEEGVMVNDVAELQRQLRQAKEQLKRQQVLSEERKNKLIQLEGKESAMEQYIEEFTKQRRQLEDENDRLGRELQQLKEEQQTGGQSAPLDSEFAKDPAYHFEFILNTAAKIRMENDRLRDLLQKHNIQDVDELGVRGQFSPRFDGGGGVAGDLDRGVVYSPQDQLQMDQLQSREAMRSAELPLTNQESLPFRSASAKLYHQTSMSPSPRIIRPRRVLTTVGGPRLGRVKGNVMTAIEVVPDAP